MRKRSISARFLLRAPSGRLRFEAYMFVRVILLRASSGRARSALHRPQLRMQRFLTKQAKKIIANIFDAGQVGAFWDTQSYTADRRNT